MRTSLGFVQAPGLEPGHVSSGRRGFSCSIGLLPVLSCFNSFVLSWPQLHPLLFCSSFFYEERCHVKGSQSVSTGRGEHSFSLFSAVVHLSHETRNCGRSVTAHSDSSWEGCPNTPCRPCTWCSWRKVNGLLQRIQCSDSSRRARHAHTNAHHCPTRPHIHFHH